MTRSRGVNAMQKHNISLLRCGFTGFEGNLKDGDNVGYKIHVGYKMRPFLPRDVTTVQDV